MFHFCIKIKDVKPIQNGNVSKGECFNCMFAIYLNNDLVREKNILKNWKFKKEEYLETVFGI